MSRAADKSTDPKSEKKREHRSRRAQHEDQEKDKKAPKNSVGARPLYAQAIRFFLDDNTTFESTEAVDAVMVDVEAATKLNEVFLAPIRHKILGIEGALRFAFFLAVNEPRDDEEAFPRAARFSADEAFKAAAKVYDLGVDELASGYIKSSYEGSDDEDSGSDTGSEPEDDTGKPKIEIAK